MRQSELAMWYLEQKENELNADDLGMETTIVNKIIKRLLKTVSVTVDMILHEFHLFIYTLFFIG
jgi:hypothetical protein